MHKICVINQKGGVGKTTTTVNLAAGLARAGKKILLIDLDPQGNLETCFQFHEEKKDMYHILFENADPKECIHRIATNLDLIASSDALIKAELSLVNRPAKEYIISQKLNDITEYDYIIMDCAPSLGLLTQNALLFCQEAFVPASTDIMGIEAAMKVVKNIEVINETFAHDVQVTKIIPTMYDQRNKLARECLKKVQNHFYEKVTIPIRINVKLAEAVKHKKSIFAHANSSRGAEDFRELVRNVLHTHNESNTEMNVNIREGKKVKAAAK